LYNYSDAYSTGETEVPLFFDDRSGDTFVQVTNGFFSSSFNPSSTREYYEFRWINNGATSGSLYMNEVAFFSVPLNLESFITDWEDSGLTASDIAGCGTVTSVNIQKAYIGSSLYLSGYFTTGTTAASEFQLNLPDSRTIGGVPTDTYVSGYLGPQAASADRYAFVLTKGDTYLNLAYLANSASAAGTPQDGDILASSTRHTFWVGPIPITDKLGTLTATEAQVQTSRARFYRTSASSPTANTAIPFDTTSTLLAIKGQISNSSGEITVDRPGTWRISFGAGWTSIAGAGAAYLAVGGTRTIDLDTLLSTATGASGSVEIDITNTATETLSIRVDQNITTLQTGDQNTWVSIVRLSDRSAQIPGFPFSDNATESKQYLVPDYREYDYTFSNSGTANINGTVKLIRVGKKVTAYFNDITHDSASAPLSDAWVPSGYTPYVGSGSRVSTLVDSQSAYNTFIAILSTGTLQIVHRDWSGTLSAQTGVNYSYSVTWTTEDV
jgi:hypothetical protein